MPTHHSALSPELIAAIEAGAWVLTPNQQSAHWLKLRYANHASSQGRVAWATPSIYSFNHFVAHLWRTQSKSNERVLTAEQSQLLWERVVAQSAWAEHLLNPLAAASTSYQSWERLQAWRISRQQLLLQIEQTNSDESRALLEWNDRFTELCASRAWLPVALLPQCLLELNPKVVAPCARVISVTADLLPSHRHLLQQLVERGLRWEILSTQSPLADTRVVACESFDDEMRAAAKWTEGQMQRSSNASIGIVVPELETSALRLQRAFNEVFAQQERAFSIREQNESSAPKSQFSIAVYHRLADFPVVRAALDLLQLINGRANVALVGTVLRSAFLTANAEEASLRAFVDVRLRSAIREHYDLSDLERATRSCPLLNQGLLLAQSLRLAAQARALPSAIAEHFLQLWKALGWPGEGSLNSEEQQIVARLHQCLAEFGALDELLQSLTFSAAVSQFEKLVRDTSFEPRSVPTSITIVDSNAVEGLRFDAVWVMSVDETRWPPPATPDAFIPIVLQIEASMRNATAQLTRERARQHFISLRRLSSHAVFSWAKADRDAEILPSAWLVELSPDVRALPTESLPDTTYAAAILANKPALESLVETSAPPLSMRANERVRGGTRIFELQSKCPFRAFAELRLHATPLDEVVPNVDASERGTLVHAALADVWQQLGGSSGLHLRSNSQLEDIVRTALARYSTPLLDGASLHRVRLLQIEQELATERILTLLSIDRQRAAFRVAGRPETKEQVRVGPLTFELRLDRVDELLDASHAGLKVIIDYKTGDTVSTQSWIRDRPEQPQLPLYAVTHPDALAGVVFATLGAKEVGYQGVVKEDGLLPGVKQINEKYLPSPYVQWNGLLAFWDVVITRLATQFANGHAVVDPLLTACRYCHLSTLCRVNEQKAFSLLEEEPT